MKPIGVVLGLLLAITALPQSISVTVTSNGTTATTQLPPSIPIGTYSGSLLLQAPISPIGTSPTQVAVEPPPPVLPGRWKTYVDPVFKTTILQLTDATDGTNCGISYGMWTPFNADSTKIMIACDGNTILYTWNPSSMQVISKTVMPSWFLYGDAIWSHYNTNLVYNRAGTGISAYSVATGINTPIVNWSQVFYDAPFSFRMTASEDDNVFCWAREKTDYSYVGWGCWRKSTNTFWHEPKSRFGQYFKVWIDKSGRYLWNVGGLATGVESEIFDLGQSGNSIGTLLDAAPDYSPGHGGQGPGWVVGGNDYLNQDNRRSWSTMHTWTPTSPSSSDWSQAGEFTMLNTASDYYYIASNEWEHPHVDGLFHDELFGRTTNGSGAVKRLAHIHNYMSGYDSETKPAISYDGKWIGFDSNMGIQNGRRDVFIVRVP